MRKVSTAEVRKNLDRRALRLEDMDDTQIQEMIDAEIPQELCYTLADISEVD